MKKQRVIDFDGDWNDRAGAFICLGVGLTMLVVFTHAALTDFGPDGRMSEFERSFSLTMTAALVLLGLVGVLSRRRIRIDPARGELLVQRWIAGVPRHRCYPIDGRGELQIETRQIKHESVVRDVFAAVYSREGARTTLFTEASQHIVRRRAKWLAKRLGVALEDETAP